MYHKIGVVIAIFCLFISCRKKDINFGTPNHTHCEIERSDGPVVDLFPVSGGVRKTFYENGLVKSLDTRAFHFLGVHIDSIKCTFTYSQNVAHVKEYMVDLEFNPEDGTVTGASGSDPNLPRTLEYDVMLNPKTGYATSAGDMQFVYSNGRLQSYTFGTHSYAFQYDNKGNVIRESTGSAYWLHEYDQNSTARYQYYSVPRQPGHDRYVVLRMLGWLPLMHKNLLTRSRSFIVDGAGPGIDYEFSERTYSNHNVDQNGFLLSYLYNNVETINTQWKCTSMKAPGKEK